MNSDKTPQLYCRINDLSENAIKYALPVYIYIYNAYVVLRCMFY